MGRLLAKYRDWLLGAGLFCAALALMAYPQESMEAARDGLSLCANVIVPSLFPFFALAALVVELGLSRYLGKLLEGVMAPLFRVNGACASALALGFVGSAPKPRPNACWPSATTPAPRSSSAWWARGCSPAGKSACCST